MSPRAALTYAAGICSALALGGLCAGAAEPPAPPPPGAGCIYTDTVVGPDGINVIISGYFSGAICDSLYVAAPLNTRPQ